MPDFAFSPKKPLSRKKWADKMENKIYKEQGEHITKYHGKETNANLGWGVSADKDYLSVASKVYPGGGPRSPKKAYIIKSEANYPSEEVTHQFEKY